MKDFRTTLEKIQKAENTIFSVTFTKKDGTIRTMVARLNVKKGVKGTGMAYNPIEKGLLPVFDMQKNGFRMINLKTVTELTIKGEGVL
ncbi:MAG: hypothetical protein GOVbin4342_3 [Prokaryotic dsDNA virus sp.]|nr:MAG: hypothetical protein GOVbin4342_3 [Prokaryotic dsDNA virus sp.]|tara:strand:- start:395 stop:658 length:264 start_codon:yes stop_codon:yes gene_type:complete